MGIKLKNIRFTEHALLEMKRRGITKQEVLKVLSSPEQVIDVRKGRVVFQSFITKGKSPRTYLLRVFVDSDRNPPEIVTAYFTSKIGKYLEEGHESHL